jgi:hypothetical protein
MTTGLLKFKGTTSTNPNPSSLTTSNPYPVLGSNLSGTITVATGVGTTTTQGDSIIGSGTTFQTDFAVGNKIVTAGGQTKRIYSITSNTLMNLGLGDYFETSETNVTYKNGGYVNRYVSSAKWQTQATSYCNALIPRETLYGSNNQTELNLGFQAIGGTLTGTYSIDIWVWSATIGAWLEYQRKSFTGDAINSNATFYWPLTLPGFDPIFIQITAIPSNFLQINYDAGVAVLL